MFLYHSVLVTCIEDIVLLCKVYDMEKMSYRDVIVQLI